MEANKTYQLIRANAGSKMIREAEQMIAYDYVNELLSEQQQSAAIQRMSRFLDEYPVPEKETPPNLLNFSEVAQIDFKDLQEIHSIYLEILRSLTWDNNTTAGFVNEAISQALKAAYRIPLTNAVSNKDAFEYVYTKWYQVNESSINNSHKRAFDMDFDDEVSLARSLDKKDRYVRVQNAAAAFKEHNAIVEQLRELGDYGPYDEEEVCGGGEGYKPKAKPVIHALFAAFDRAAAAKVQMKED
jgi:hypothetical protein